jgi:hypothetical protein
MLKRTLAAPGKPLKQRQQGERGHVRVLVTARDRLLLDLLENGPRRSG